MKNLLIVDDEKLSLNSLSETLKFYNGKLNIMTAANGEQAIGILENTKVDLLITDLNMPVRSGFELLAYMMLSRAETPVIVMTGSISDDTGEILRSLNVRNFVTKPVTFETLNAMINDILDAGGQTGEEQQDNEKIIPT